MSRLQDITLMDFWVTHAVLCIMHSTYAKRTLQFQDINTFLPQQSILQCNILQIFLTVKKGKLS